MSAPIDKTFIREYDKNDGNVLKIHQSEIGDVGCVVWDAALVLSKYLEKQNDEKKLDLSRKTVIELGAGTGVVSLVAGSLGAKVTITDLPEFLPLISLNIQENKALLTGEIKAETLIWGQVSDVMKKTEWDLILLADCIYYEESLEPLVRTMVELCGPRTTILCCYEQRDTGNKPELEKQFFELVRKNFEVSKIPLEDQDNEMSSADIHILLFTQRIVHS
ncbi:hypothetical protein LOTGIDRAFT_237692 [Lottia gigantea]|uniref:Protein-lysine methyltransferase METTL21D n=1 Tax=Lottia gigantea TaxID=225164 RepID=V4BBG2_LOTGI|nr:hypothetical protein LOTGIDRAFT_237692 [Lottia gigantea]ESP03382.1 hypothetical protein LOTGIDRAFT_237692 [Lottia gigantea]